MGNDKKIPTEIKVQSLNISKNKGFSIALTIGIIAGIFILIITLHNVFDTTNKSAPGIQNSTAIQTTGLEKLDTQFATTTKNKDVMKIPNDLTAQENSSILNVPVDTSIKNSAIVPDKIAPKVEKRLDNAIKNQEQILELINPLLNKYSLLIEAIETQLPLFESLNQVYTSSIANLRKLQGVIWRNDVDGVINQLLYEEKLLLAYVNQAKARQSFAKGKIESYNSGFKMYGAEPLDDNLRKIVNDNISEADGWLFQYNLNNPDSINATLHARSLEIDKLMSDLFQRLRNTQ